MNSSGRGRSTTGFWSPFPAAHHRQSPSPQQPERNIQRRLQHRNKYLRWLFERRRRTLKCHTFHTPNDGSITPAEADEVHYCRLFKLAVEHFCMLSTAFFYRRLCCLTSSLFIFVSRKAWFLYVEPFGDGALRALSVCAADTTVSGLEELVLKRGAWDTGCCVQASGASSTVSFSMRAAQGRWGRFLFAWLRKVVRLYDDVSLRLSTSSSPLESCYVNLYLLSLPSNSYKSKSSFCNCSVECFFFR
jgi:hypothetical protein